MTKAFGFGRRPKLPGEPLRGRYLVRNRLWNAWLRANDFALELLAKQRAVAPNPRAKTPSRILVAVSGHLGDAVIATSVLPPILAAFPGVEIGVLTGSWNAQIFSGHRHVARIHCVDHWRLARSDSLAARWLATRRTRNAAIGDLGAARYDAAIDLSAYYPNFADVLWRAGIPVRVGFTSGGSGPLRTHPVDWAPGRHVSEDHMVLLEAIVPGIATGVAPRYDMPPLAAESLREAEHRLALYGTRAGEYVALHAGAGVARKEWPVSKWRAVVRDFAGRGIPVVLTGAGEHQAALTRAIADGNDGVFNLCDRLEWGAFRAVVERAGLVISVDTVAMHLAAAAGTPCIALMTAMDDPQRWRPIGDGAMVLTEPVRCAPCYRSRGCAEMACVRDVSVEKVLAAVKPYLRSGDIEKRRERFRTSNV